jgi:ABC-type multidrug transport system ATPase subunit
MKEELGLTHIRTSLVRSWVRGVSGGGLNLYLLIPSFLLLDGPTIGLDATTAQSLLATLRDLAYVHLQHI